MYLRFSPWIPVFDHGYPYLDHGYPYLDHGYPSWDTAVMGYPSWDTAVMGYCRHGIPVLGHGYPYWAMDTRIGHGYPSVGSWQYHTHQLGTTSPTIPGTPTTVLGDTVAAGDGLAGPAQRLGHSVKMSISGSPTYRHAHRTTHIAPRTSHHAYLSISQYLSY